MNHRRAPRIVVIGTAILCAGAGIACSLFAPAPPRTVVLRVTGAQRPSVLWRRGGDSSQISVSTPWTTQFAARPGEYISLVANSSYEPVVCEVLVDGAPWKRAEASAGGACSVSGAIEPP